MKRQVIGDPGILIREVALRPATADEVRQYGAVADDGCVAFDGAQVLMQRYQFGNRGIEIPGAQRGTQVMLDPDDADAAFRPESRQPVAFSPLPNGGLRRFMTFDDAMAAYSDLTPGVAAAGVLPVFLAGIFGEFDDHNRLRSMGVLHLLFETERDLQQYRPGKLPAAIRRRMANGFTRFGDVAFHTTDRRRYQGRDDVFLSESDMGDVFDRREQLVEQWEADGRPSVALVGVN